MDKYDLQNGIFESVLLTFIACLPALPSTLFSGPLPLLGMTPHIFGLLFVCSLASHSRFVNCAKLCFVVGIAATNSFGITLGLALEGFPSQFLCDLCFVSQWSLTVASGFLALLHYRIFIKRGSEERRI